MSSVEIQDATIIDGSGTAPLHHATIRVSGGRIAAVWTGDARPDEARQPADRTMNGAGTTVIPGLIDAHCHLSYGEGKTAEEIDIYGGAEWSAVRAVWNAQKVVRSGFTSVCDPGSTWNVAVTVRDAVASGMFEGPRVLAAGRHISADGAFADYFPSWLGMPVSAEGVLCSSIGEMRSEVRRQVKNRVDLIKISGDSQAQERLPHCGPAFTEDEFSAIVGLAHQLGRKVTIHARYPETIVQAVRAGVDWIIHASYMRREDIGYIRDSGIPLCPTLTFTANIVEHGTDVGVDPNYIEVKRRELDALVDIYQAAHEAGIPLLAGSESGFSVTPYGEWHAREMELLVEYVGLSSMQAIAAGTVNNARAFGWDDEVGRITPGLRADLVVLQGNPLEDIHVLGDRSQIQAVVKEGELVSQNGTLEVTRRRMSHERGLSVSSDTLHRVAER